jgi:hypothetical protein
MFVAVCIWPNPICVILLLLVELVPRFSRSLIVLYCMLGGIQLLDAAKNGRAADLRKLIVDGADIEFKYEVALVSPDLIELLFYTFLPIVNIDAFRS